MSKCATCGGPMPCAKHAKGGKEDMAKKAASKFMKLKGKK